MGMPTQERVVGSESTIQALVKEFPWDWDVECLGTLYEASHYSENPKGVDKIHEWCADHSYQNKTIIDFSHSFFDDDTDYTIKVGWEDGRVYLEQNTREYVLRDEEEDEEE